MAVGKGFADRLSHPRGNQPGRAGGRWARSRVDGKRVLVIIPDGTRTMPMPLMYDLLEAHLAPRVAALDYLVALGTHPIMNDEHLSKLVGRPVTNGQCGKSHIFNHHWEDPRNFVTLGVIPAAEIGELTGGLLAQEVPVRLNKLIRDYDQIIICGPVFPHEVAGFSRRHQVLLPGHRRPGDHQPDPLVRRLDDQLQGHRLGLYAHPRHHRSRRRHDRHALGLLRAGGDARRAGGDLLRLAAGSMEIRRRRYPPKSTSST